MAPPYRSNSQPVEKHDEVKTGMPGIQSGPVSTDLAKVLAEEEISFKHVKHAPDETDVDWPL
jgi:hypothetical protein